MALIPTRQLVVLLLAAGVTAPVVWWALDGAERGVGAAARRLPAAVDDAVAVPEKDAAGAELGERAATPRPAADGPHPAALGDPVATGRRPLFDAGPKERADETALDLGVLLHGDLRTAVPGLSGKVVIDATGPDGERLDAHGTIGEPYSLLGLAPGTWDLVVRGRAILEQRVNVEIDVERGAVELDLLLQPAPVVPVVFYTSWGERLESALAEPGHDPAGFPWIEILGAGAPGVEGTWLDEPGGFRRARVADDPDAPLPEVSGLLDLRTAPPVEVRVVQAGRELERRLIEDPTQLLEFQVDPLEESGRPTLSASFVDALSGDAIAHAVVELYRAGEPAPVRSRPLAAGGSLRMAGIGPGEWILSVLSSGRAPLVRGFEIEAEADYDLGIIALEPAVALSGRLVGPDGRPLANRAVRWSQLGPTPRLAGAYGHEVARTDAGGAFALPAVPSNPILLLAGGDEFAARLFEVRPGSAGEPLTLQLDEGFPVDVVLGDGDGVEGRCDLEIRDASERLLAVRPVASGRVTRVILGTGRYSARVIRAGAVLGEQFFAVADESVALEIDVDDSP